MKKWLILILLVCLFILLFFIFKKDKKLEEKNIYSAFASTLEKDFYLVKPDGKESILEKKEILAGEVVETSSTGRGVIESLSGNITVVDYLTSFKVAKNQKEPVEESIFLSGGDLWARVSKIFGKGEFYEIETKNAVAIVRGTSFGVGFRNGKTLLRVTEGKVLIMPVSSTTSQRLFEKSKIVSAGYKALVDENLNILVSEITSNDKKDPWYIYNNQPVLPYQKIINSIEATGFQNPISTTTTINTNTNTPSGTQTSSSTGTNASGSGGGIAPASSVLSLNSVSPRSVYQGEDITLTGSGFNNITGLSIGTFVIPRNYLNIIDDNTLSLNVGDISSGIYDISVVDSNNNIKALSRALTVNDIPYDPSTYGP